MHLKYKSGSSWVDYNLVVYPVGALYFSFTSTSPANLFGGTWTPITGRFLYMNAGNSSHNATKVTVLSPLSSYIKSSYEEDSTNGYGLPNKYHINGLGFQNRVVITTGAGMNISGGNWNGSFSNASPALNYQTVYAWRRTA